MEIGPQNRNRDGFLGPNSIIVVYMDPLGFRDSSNTGRLGTVQLTRVRRRRRLRASGYRDAWCEAPRIASSGVSSTRV